MNSHLPFETAAVCVLEGANSTGGGEAQHSSPPEPTSSAFRRLAFLRVSAGRQSNQYPGICEMCWRVVQVPSGQSCPSLPLPSFPVPALVSCLFLLPDRAHSGFVSAPNQMPCWDWYVWSSPLLNSQRRGAHLGLEPQCCGKDHFTMPVS